jgi:hypothetical protein
MGRARSMNEEKKNEWWKARRKIAPRRIRRRWLDITKINLKEIGWSGMD